MISSKKIVLSKFLKKIKASLFTVDTLIFLIFLLISMVFWFFNMSGKRHTIDVSVKVEYRDFPHDIHLITPLPDEINVRLHGMGLNILKYAFQSPDMFVISYSDFLKNDSLLYIPSYKLEDLVRPSLKNSTVDLIGLPQISTHFYKKAQKRLLVRLTGGVSLHSQYTLQDSICITPQWVNVFGQQEVIDTMQYAYVNAIPSLNVDKDIFYQQAFMNVEGITYEPCVVNVSAKVEVLTEKRLQIPIRCVNLPSDIYLHLFPSSVDVIFSVGLSKFNSVAEHDIEVVLDYNELLKNVTGKQHLNVQTKLPFIHNLKVYPQEIEFLLEEN